MQDTVNAVAQASDFGALKGLVQAVGAITSAALAIGLTWRRGGQWVPYQEDLPKAAERVGGVVTAVVIALLWAQYNDHRSLPFLNRVAIACAASALAAFLVYGFLVALHTYKQDVSTTKRERFIKVVGGLWLTPAAAKKVAGGADVQSLFKDAAYNPDRIWTRAGRALAQGAFALFFILLTCTGTVALSAAAMVYLIRQSPAPPPDPVALTGLTLVIPEAVARDLSSGSSADAQGYRIALDGALIGEVLASDIRTGGHFAFDATVGRHTLALDNGTAPRTCPLDLRSESPKYAVTSVSASSCTAGSMSKQAYDDFVARRKGAANATLTLTFEGASEVLVRADAKEEKQTPDNNGNRGSCPNEVGREDGRFCISRTTVTLKTEAPKFWKNPRTACAGSGCPWSRTGSPAVSRDGLTATGYIDNWGSAVTISLVADEYSRVGSRDCGPDVRLTASTLQAARFSVPKSCAGLAIIKWELPDGRTGAFRADEKMSPGGEFVMEGGPADQGTALAIAYKRAG